jgi:hypothetical protein
MGGFGSGDWADLYLRKTSVEQCMTISAKKLNEFGFFAGDKSGVITWTNAFGEKTGEVKIQSVMGGNGNTTYLELEIGGFVTSRQKIELISTVCNYGGIRYWFLCPAVKDEVYCGNRVTKLFLPPGGSVFGCRQCYDLTYQSCQESHKYDKVFGHIEGADIDSLSVTQALRLGGL